MRNVIQLTNRKMLKVLMTVMIFFSASNSVMADYVSEGFDNISTGYDSSWNLTINLPEGWNYSGNANGLFDVATDLYKTEKPAIRMEGSNTSLYLITPKLVGNFMFYMRNRTKSYQATATAYACTYQDGELTLGEELGSKTLDKETSPSWKLTSFTAVSATRVALLISNGIIDDFVYEPCEGDVVVDPELIVTKTTVDFGSIQAENTQTLAVRSNVNTNVSFAISGDGAEAFSLVDAPASLVANSPAAVNIKMSATTAGTYTATLTVTAGTLSKKVVLTGVWEEPLPEPQPENWKGENFDGYKEGDAMPMGWTAEGWEIAESFLLDNVPVVQTNNGGTLRTPVFEVTAHQALQFFFQKSYSGWSYDSKLVVSYSTDKVQWTEAAAYDKDEANGTKKVALPAAGSYYVRFVANDRTYLDDFLVVDNTETGISDLTPSQRHTLTGSTLSPSEEATYNLCGQRLGTMANGQIHIVKGKKFIKK